MRDASTKVHNVIWLEVELHHMCRKAYLTSLVPSRERAVPTRPPPMIVQGCSCETYTKRLVMDSVADQASLTGQYATAASVTASCVERSGYAKSRRRLKPSGAGLLQRMLQIQIASWRQQMVESIPRRRH